MSYLALALTAKARLRGQHAALESGGASSPADTENGEGTRDALPAAPPCPLPAAASPTDPPGTRRPGAPDFMEAVARLLGLDPGAFAEADQALEVRVPWLAVPLWFVPTETDAEALVTEGITRGHVWTAGELADLLTLGPTRAHVHTVTRVKAAFDGEVAAVRTPDRCRACGGWNWWRSVHGPTVCARCHPPVAPELVARWIGGEPSSPEPAA